MSALLLTSICSKRNIGFSNIDAESRPDQTFLKGAQVGISTVVLLKALYVCDELDKKAIYFFQDDNAVSDFANDRCDPIIQNSPYLSSRIRSTFNVQLKHSDLMEASISGDYGLNHAPKARTAISSCLMKYQK